VDSHDASGTVARFQLTLDPVGNPTAATTTRGANTQTVGYTYDAADRVTAACVGAPGCTGTTTGKTTYAYDAVGNRRSQTQSGSAGTGTTTYTYDAADELTSTKAGGHQVDYGYDAEGNQVKAGNDTFTYNLDHSMASATVGGVRTTYAYDAQGIQISAVSNASGGPRSRSWATDVNSAQPSVSVETTATPTNSTTRGFLPGPQGSALALLAGGETDPYLPDWLDGVATVVSAQGQVRAAYDYDPFGNPRTDGTAAPTGSTVDNPVRFAGMYLDAALGARYTTVARAYDPGIGRFSGREPTPRSLMAPAASGYAYVGDRATTLIDPSGADPCSTGGDGCGNYDPSTHMYKPCGPYTSPDTCDLINQVSDTPPPYHPCGPYTSPDTCDAINQGSGTSPAPPAKPAPQTQPKPQPQKKSGLQQVAMTLADWANKISGWISWIPGFICEFCAGVTVALGILAAVGYAVAEEWGKMASALTGAVLNAVMGGASDKLLAGGLSGLASREILYKLGKAGWSAWNIVLTKAYKIKSITPTPINKAITTAVDWIGNEIGNLLGDLIDPVYGN
jgi:RHS repeat-associated protein